MGRSFLICADGSGATSLTTWLVGFPTLRSAIRLQTLVEIKPVMSVLEIEPKTLTKIENAVSNGTRVLLLGADPTNWMAGTIVDAAPTIGWAIGNGDLHFGWTEGNGLPGMCSLDGAWFSYLWHDMNHKAGRVSGGWNVPMDARTMLVTYWRKACNEVQWMGGKHGN